MTPFRDHFKSSHILDKRKNFHMGTRGLDLIRCAIDRKKKARPYVDRSCCGRLQIRASLQLSVASHCVIWKKSKRKRQEVRACGCNRSIANIKALKARLKGKIGNDRQALAPVRHCRSTPAASLLTRRKRKKWKSYYSSRLSPLVHFAMDTEPPGKRPWVRQTALFEQVVGKKIMCIAICHTLLPLSITLSFEEGRRG